MPRCARKKDNSSVYHVMVKGISDNPLFKLDEEKDKFLNLIKKYKEIFFFKIYAYCVMDTHAHFIIDSNGSDISRFMHVINQCYAQFYNKKHNRFGHVFGDRFKSKIVDDDRYLITLSGYIHNNPLDLPAHKNNIENYKYSSLGAYTGISNDIYKILDTNFILQQFSYDIANSQKLYRKFVGLCTNKNMIAEMEFRNESTDYRSGRTILVRDFTYNQILFFVSTYISTNSSIFLKYSSTNKCFRALTILLMHSLCNLSYKEICTNIGNITVSQASKLSYDGLKLTKKFPEINTIFSDFIIYSKHTS